MTLVKNPFWPGTAEIPQYKIDQVHFVMLDAVAQLAEYEAGNIDVTNGVPSEDLDRIRADATLGRLSQDPSLCTYFYGNTTAPVMSRAPRHPMAVDRQSLIDNVIRAASSRAVVLAGANAAPPWTPPRRASSTMLQPPG
jgi:ABC-type transport system substrate-binding protein